MRPLSRVLWILLSGLWLAVVNFLFGIVCCLTIIFIPFGLKYFMLAQLCWDPQSQQVHPTERMQTPLRLVLNILWIISCGLGIALFHVFLAVIFAITLIGIPFARHHLTIASFSLLPFGQEIRPLPAPKSERKAKRIKPARSAAIRQQPRRKQAKAR
jgi:uncharacterized membrane protein YccF (DUF307 family)